MVVTAEQFKCLIEDLISILANANNLIIDYYVVVNEVKYDYSKLQPKIEIPEDLEKYFTKLYNSKWE